MAQENEAEVKFVDRVEVTPAEGENIDEEIETPQDSSPETIEEDIENEETEEESIEEETPTEEEPEESEVVVNNNEKYGEVKHLQGETPREFALRIENARLRDDNRKKQSGEIFIAPPAISKTELSPERKKVLEKYKPEDIQTLKEVFDVMAEDMGFVKKEQLGQSSYQEKATEVLDEFLENHPEYQPKNDPGNILWDRFKSEYSLYKQPDNPRALKQILNKIHKDVFGIQSTTALNKNEAAREKIKVASHSSSSRPTPSREGVKRNVVSQGLRTDMLKGFSDEEIEELTS